MPYTLDGNYSLKRKALEELEQSLNSFVDYMVDIYCPTSMEFFRDTLRQELRELIGDTAEDVIEDRLDDFAELHMKKVDKWNERGWRRCQQHSLSVQRATR